MNFKLNGGETVTGNQFVGPVSPTDAAARWPSNTYRCPIRPTSGQAVFVRPNAYEPGRANITIYNWGKATSVAVSLAAAGLASGDNFEVRDTQNFYGAPVATGTYAGAPIPIPMTGLTAADPVANALRGPGHTAPEFGAFVLLRTSGGGGGGGGDTTAPVVSVTAPMPELVVSGAATMSASASDDVGVVGVQFQLDGLDVGAEDTAAPFSLTWIPRQRPTALTRSRLLRGTLLAIARLRPKWEFSSTMQPIASRTPRTARPQ